jgi:hypothetical protein
MRVRARHQHHSGGRTISVGQWPAVISRPRAGEQLLKRGLPRAAVSAEPPHRGPLVVAQQPASQPIQRLWENNSALSPSLGQPHPASRPNLLRTAVINVNQYH